MTFRILVGRAKNRTHGGFALLGLMLVITLMIVGVVRHPASLGIELFIQDLTLLIGYGAFFQWGRRQRSFQMRETLTSSAPTGLILGVILALSHTTEWLGLDGNQIAQFVRGAGSTLLMLGMLGAEGSATWDRTQSMKLAVIAGLWCGSLATIILLCFALALNLAFEAHSVEWLREAFAASGMRDSGAFVVRNALESESEILVRMPIAALVLSLIGSVANACLFTRSRKVLLASAWIIPFAFVGGIASLWYAGSLPRAARPPFVLGGVLATGLALCGAHPIWSKLFAGHREALRRT